jgi:RNA polymerase sigma factor (sigma-70 family)
LEDEQLVLLVQRSGHVPARDELIARFNGLKDRLICWRAARSGLQEADRMDAQQDAVLWILEAIREYKTRGHTMSHGCRFRTFLQRVLLARFIDLLRRRGRQRARLLLGGCTLGSLTSPTNPDHNGRAMERASSSGEPQRLLERDELMARLHEELGQLGTRAQLLWELLARGLRVRDIATALDLSYYVVKRRRRKLIVHLRACLDK